MGLVEWYWKFRKIVFN